MHSLARALIQNSILLLAVFFVVGCSTPTETVRLCADDEGNFHACADIEMGLAEIEIEKEKSSDFQSIRSFQTLNEYTEQMVYQLSQKLSEHQVTDLIVVPPFVSLSRVESSNPHLAIDLAEAFILDMQAMGFSTAELIVANTSIDYHADYLTYLDAATDNSDIGYLLKGSMKKTKSGMMVYARIIDLANNKVIASANKLLPLYLIQ